VRVEPWSILCVALASAAIALVAAPEFLPSARSGASAEIPSAIPAEPSGSGDPSRARSASPEFLARTFRAPRPEPVKEEAPAAIAVEVAPPPLEIADAEWLAPVGSVRDETGALRLYFKDSRGGKILKVRVDGAAEGGTRLVAEEDARYLLELGEEQYYVRRKK